MSLVALVPRIAGNPTQTTVDVNNSGSIWDGFVDGDGDFAMQGPDFEGQTRRLRTVDGVYFTKPGAVKLASYVDRELRRVMPSHVAPVALPGRETPANSDRLVRGPMSVRYCLYPPVTATAAATFWGAQSTRRRRRPTRSRRKS